MKGIIMAGGEGARLRPMTCGKPKPMIEIMDRPVMEYIIELLKSHDITEIGVTLQYMPQAIMDYFGDGERFGVHLTYFIEESPLGTAGSVKNAEEFLDSDFVIISGDCFTDINLTDAILFHHEKKASATLVLSRVESPLEYGVVVTKQDGAITRFLEKPSWSEVFSDTVNTGIYILSPYVLKLFRRGIKYDFSHDLFPRLLADGQPIFGYTAAGYWCDIGDLEAYSRCHRDILDGKVNVNIHASKNESGVYLAKGAHIDLGVSVSPPAYIGTGARIHSGAKIMPYSVIGEGCKIFEGSSVGQTVLHRGVSLGKMSQARGCVLCEGVSVGTFSSVAENAVIGERTALQEMCEVRGGIKIWPQKLIEKGSVVSANLVWGGRFSRKLFGSHGVRGEVNIDITPEFATKLGATLGGMLRGGNIGLGYGSGGALLMLKNAFASGLLSSGCEVFDFDVQSLPLTRRCVPFYGLAGGVHLTLDKDALIINFLDRSGADLSRSDERSLEALFSREDFVRAEPDDIGNITKISNYNLYYLSELAQATREQRISGIIALTSENYVALELARTSLQSIGCEVRASSDPGIVCANIDVTGENITVTDELGRLLDKNTFLTLIFEILASQNLIATFVAPISAPDSLVELAQRIGVQLVRCKTGRQDVMRELISLGLRDQLYMMYDPAYFLCRLMIFLTDKGSRLCDITDSFPSVHMTEREVECAAERKGRVMRALAPEEVTVSAGDGDNMPREGVRIENDEGWVLIIPHSERPVCRVIAEGSDMEMAEELCSFYAEQIRKIAEDAK